MTEKQSEPGVRKAGTAMGMLIRQFSQPLACLRELVQNSIDAGSNQVEVTLNEVDAERVCLAVRDTGEGMNRRIIETQLTRLFASAKDGDLTKVGKFGIGFVSVFSLQPLAVVVDTGREGEFWRILFHPDQSYELLRLSQKVEGTVVNIYLARGSTDLQQKLRRVEETLRYWCKHCQVEILFNGQVISQPFRLGLPHELAHEQPGTRMALALTTQSENFAGFYNQGLTLLEGVCSPLPYLSFKVDSRYFEHTLTRDNVIENEDYTKALELIRQTVREVLAPQLYARLRSGSEEWPLLGSLRELGVDSEEAELVPDLSGQFWSLKQLRGCRLYHQSSADALSRRPCMTSRPPGTWPRVRP
ncbi:MAG: ATP-binding protein [Vulcanimicrobiota bacterium]